MNIIKKTELINLATEILQNIELNELKLAGVIPKAMRLARLKGDTQSFDWLKLEYSGYPQTPEGIPQSEFQIGAKSGRHYQERDKTKEIKTYMRPDSVGKFESDIETAKLQLQLTADAPVSISSANPNQFLSSGHSNHLERSTLRTTISTLSGQLEKIKSAVYQYVLDVYFELSFTDITETIFESTRERVDKHLAKVSPNAVRELVTAYQNAASDNEADWSNATNSCRRLMKEIADKLFPAIEENRDGHKLTEDAYKNRLIAFVKTKSTHRNFNNIVGSQISFIADRLDALHDTSSQGVHSAISKQDVERIIVYTYLVLGDILSLLSDEKLETIEKSAVTNPNP